MITEIDYNHRLLNANVHVCTPNKALRFVGYNHARLRALFHFVQTRVAEIRQHYTMLQQGQGQISQQQPATDEPYAAFPALVQQFQASAPQQELPGTKLRVPQIVQAQNYRQSAPVISAYTRLPLMSRQRRFLGSRAMNSPQPSLYQ
jgi:hypothetical protein